MRSVTLELGGQERRLRLDLNAIAAIGDKLDIKVRINHLTEDLMSTPLPPSALRTILWGSLLHEDPGLTEFEVGGWVDVENMREVATAFFGLFGTRLPEKDRQEIAEKLGIAEPDKAEEPVLTAT